MLFFTRGAQTKDIWFYDMAHDGFSLDDKRIKTEENDIPDVLACWTNRFDKKFSETREKRIGELRGLLAPLKEERRKMQAEINRLTFEAALENPLTTENTESTEKNKKKNSPERPSGLRVDSVRSVVNALSESQARLAALESQIAAPQSVLDRLTRQFWVTKEQVASAANKYDLSASRYRHALADADALYHDKPSVTLERLSSLEQVMLDEIREMGKVMNDEGSH